MDENEEDVVAVLHQGKLFGESMLMFDLPRVNSVRCKTNCDIFVLTKDDFRNVLSLYPHCKFVLTTKLCLPYCVDRRGQKRDCE